MRKYFIILGMLSLPIRADAASLSLSWTDNANNESHFRVERSLTGPTLSFTLVASPPANATTYTDAGLPENTDYTYRVQACNTAGCSAFSNTANGKTPITVPVAPSGLTVTPLP